MFALVLTIAKSPILVSTFTTAPGKTATPRPSWTEGETRAPGPRSEGISNPSAATSSPIRSRRRLSPSAQNAWRTPSLRIALSRSSDPMTGAPAQLRDEGSASVQPTTCQPAERRHSTITFACPPAPRTTIRVSWPAFCTSAEQPRVVVLQVIVLAHELGIGGKGFLVQARRAVPPACLFQAEPAQEQHFALFGLQLQRSPVSPLRRFEQLAFAKDVSEFHPQIGAFAAEKDRIEQDLRFDQSALAIGSPSLAGRLHPPPAR